MYKYIGIDVSKQTFDAFGFTSTGDALSLCLPNAPRGFSRLVRAYPPGCMVVMEASGPYYLRLASFLYAQGVRVGVVNPLVIRRFSQMNLLRAKTDAKDARLIYTYATRHPVPPWTPEAPEILELKQLFTGIELINRQCTALSNQLGAFQDSGALSLGVEHHLSAALASLEAQRKAMEVMLQAIVEEHFSNTKHLLESIPGIGPKTSALLIAITGDFKRFEQVNQLIAYVGLSPRVYQSGTSVRGKGHICKMGSAQVRKHLYLCAWSAKRYNEPCKAFYNRLKAKGKPERVIKIAIANKLLRQAFAIVKSGEEFDANYDLKNVA